MEENNKKRDFLLPISIIVAALLIASSLIYSAGKNAAPGSGSQLTGTVSDAAAPSPTPSASNARPVDKNDHIRGSSKADVIVIEYSDLECPYCKQFHGTMKQVLDEYGDKVAWVYRQNPIASLHSKAPIESEASECVAELGGNDAFWTYIDRIFEVSPTNNGLDLALLPDLAEEVGVNRARFEACLESGRHKNRISKDIQDAQNAGGRGTPYSIVINKAGDAYTIPGALPFESQDPARPSVKSIIDQALK